MKSGFSLVFYWVKLFIVYTLVHQIDQRENKFIPNEIEIIKIEQIMHSYAQVIHSLEILKIAQLFK
jgi:hypothetical protein